MLNGTAKSVGILRLGALTAALIGVGFVALVLARPAGAALVHPFLANFGTAAQPTFANPESLAVDPSNQDLLVAEAGRAEQQSLTVAATAGQFKLGFEGQTTEFWAGTGTVTCNGISTTITSAVTRAGTLSSVSVGEQISSSPVTCIQPGTKIAAVSDTTITLSQPTENNANSGTANLLAERPVNQTTGWTGTGTLTCNGVATTITAATTTTGALSKGEQISSSPATCIQPGTTIAAVSGTTITLSQPTENNANGGTVSLSADLPYNVSAVNLREALEKLSSVGAGNVAVSGGPGDAAGSTPYAIVFQGALRARDVKQITAANGGTPLSGGSGASVVTTTPGTNASVQRFKPNGEPDPFSALGTNTIDALGQIGKTCGEEAAACDRPTSPAREGLVFGAAKEVQIAVDDSGGVTDGDIFVTQGASNLVDVFGAGGGYVGQVTQYQKRTSEIQKIEFSGPVAGSTTFHLGNLPSDCTAPTTDPIVYPTGLANPRGTAIKTKLEEKCKAINPPSESFVVASSNAPVPNNTVSFTRKYEELNVPQMTCTVTSGPGSCTVKTEVEGGVPSTVPLTGVCGVATNTNGDVYIGRAAISRFVPSFNPPLPSDNVANTGVFVNGTSGACNLVTGSASTAGFLFATGSSAVNKIDVATGAFKYTVAAGANTTVAVDPSNGRVLVAAGNVATEYDASDASSATQTSTLTPPDPPSAIQGMAVKGGGEVYVTRAGGTSVEVFGPPAEAPEVTLKAATGITGSRAALAGTVNPKGGEITQCKFEYGTTPALGSSVPCEGSIPTDFSAHPVSATVTGLRPNGTSYFFRLVATNAVASVPTGQKSLVTATTVVTKPATAVTTTSATVNGSVVQEEGAAFTECKFEYLSAADYAANNNSYSGPKPAALKTCSPSVGSIAADEQAHAVSASLASLAKNTTYHFRVVATNAGGPVLGADELLTTSGPPVISDETASATKESASLRAKVNPSGSSTNYRFEWGPTTSYGQRIPADFEPSIGSGTAPVTVVANLTGLAVASHYHFRVVATNSNGTTVGPDDEFETLGAAGLPDNRAIELVSPPDKRPVGAIRGFLNTQNDFQAGEDGEALAYINLNGLADASSGGVLMYRALRSESSWSSTQVTPPALVEASNGNDASAGRVLYFSPDDLKCAALVSFNPLTADTPLADVENEVFNLYRWNAADDTYTLITNRIPLNPATAGGATSYEVLGASADCSRIFFRSGDYAFIPGASGLYEWDNGILRDAGARPDGSIPSVAGSGRKEFNAVSPSGRFFFTAISNQSGDSGKSAVFVRKSPTETVNASLPTNGPSLGVTYQAASPSGSDVLFLANYGIASTSSTGPTTDDCSGRAAGNFATTACDLYSYNVATGHLTDVSADPNGADPKGAVVQGVLDVSADGSTVYFAALGQLIPGKGRTYAQNTEGTGFANVYQYHAGDLTYVGSLKATFGFFSGALIVEQDRWTSETTEHGDFLLFVSQDNMTGANPAGVNEAYLYSAAGGTTECVSCPRDDTPPIGPAKGASILPTSTMPAAASRRALSEDGRVFFQVEDALAPDAVQGQGLGTFEKGNLENNIYEWHRGQVALLASGPHLLVDTGGPDGRDVFIQSLAQLSPEDFDFTFDVYDFRAGGGFPPPPEPPAPCDPAADQCQGAPSAVPGAPTSTTGAAGPGNAALVPVKKHHKKKHHKKHHKRKSNDKSRGRAADSNRGGAK